MGIFNIYSKHGIFNACKFNQGHVNIPFHSGHVIRVCSQHFNHNPFKTSHRIFKTCELIKDMWIFNIYLEHGIFKACEFNQGHVIIPFHSGHVIRVCLQHFNQNPFKTCIRVQVQVLLDLVLWILDGISATFPQSSQNSNSGLVRLGRHFCGWTRNWIWSARLPNLIQLEFRRFFNGGVWARTNQVPDFDRSESKRIFKGRVWNRAQGNQELALISLLILHSGVYLDKTFLIVRKLTQNINISSFRGYLKVFSLPRRGATIYRGPYASWSCITHHEVAWCLRRLLEAFLMSELGNFCVPRNLVMSTFQCI